MSKVKALGGLAVAAGLVWAVAAAPRPQRQPVGELPAAAPEPPAPLPTPVRAGLRRRFATSLAFCLIFFAGAALAAGAGNELVSSPPQVDGGSTDAALATDTLSTATDETTTVTTTTTTTAATTTDELTTTDAVTTTDDVPPATTTEPDPSDATPAPAPTPAPESDLVAAAPAAPAAAPTPAPAPVVRVAQPRAVAPAPAPAPAAPAVSPFPVIPFDPQAWLTDHPGSPTGDAAVAIADHYLGVPYRWGGNTPAGGFDCSGLTQFVYAQLGIWLPHYAAAQFLAYPRLSPSDLEPGDLVFFEPKADGPGHVAIYAGNGEIVEAPHTGAFVRIGSLAGAAASLGYLGAVRPSALVAGALDTTPARTVAGRFVAV